MSNTSNIVLTFASLAFCAISVPAMADTHVPAKVTTKASATKVPTKTHTKVPVKVHTPPKLANPLSVKP
ncbi:hypothetical protein A6M27_03760 [Acidithiobacillus thiooxidans]|uniref:Uncharacterized protein n=1 Tax=Acidithiobacillus thiooxidans TaxID=930 RepID=A0A1C2JLH7_ACITH|nr:hypothetical protein [Acidithiobacillus thiooxidans]MBU2835644.1 hypothetical protein [Acidithiobacillus thiooxidans]OCX70743.1 hypothetical protein A6M23_13510 [Acidithiobacillus thiooxidans]OCX72418.1 hypothetical protein A6P07_10090 [Acidithiobacillus thiooxidans]OCX78932.1 hypothetical protein A6O24_02965 [Acidithiobacillus thiooxidans]OCX78990.1 hypothetical protein A6O26_17420 [Acidithiobacillus thiooxidans]